MKKSLNRALALLLALTLMVGMVPAYAIGGEESVAPPVEEGIAPETPETPATTPTPDGEAVVPLAPPPEEGGDPMISSFDVVDVHFNTMGNPVGTITMKGVPTAAGGVKVGAVIATNFAYTDKNSQERNDTDEIWKRQDSFEPEVVTGQLSAQLPHIALKAEGIVGDASGNAVLYIGMTADQVPAGKTGNKYELKIVSKNQSITGEAIKLALQDLSATSVQSAAPYPCAVMANGSDAPVIKVDATKGAPETATAPRATLEAKPIDLKGKILWVNESVHANGATGFTVDSSHGANPYDIYVTNNGSATAEILSAEIAGVFTNASATITNIVNSQIPVTESPSTGTKITFDITDYSKITKNTANASITIVYNTGEIGKSDTLVIPITLTDNTVPEQPKLVVSPNSVEFRYESGYAVNAETDSVMLTVTNAGGAGKIPKKPTDVSGATDKYSVTAFTADGTTPLTMNTVIAKNETYKIKITPKAGATATITDQLGIFMSDNEATPAPAAAVYIPIKITIAAPTDPVLVATPSSHDWSYASGEAPSPASKTFNIKNNGGAATGITATLGKAASSDFEITTHPAGSLATNAPTTVVVTPKTKTTAGTYSDTLTVAAGNGGTSAVINLSQNVTAPAAHIATVLLTKDSAAYGGQTVKLSTTAATITGDITASDTVTAGTYVTGDISANKYYVFVGGKDTGETIDLTGATAATATVNYFTVTATKGASAQTATVDTKTTAVVQSGKTATLAATPATGYGGTATWTLKLTDGGTASSSTVATNTLTVNDKVTATASFEANTPTLADATVNIKYGDDMTVNGQVLAAGAGGAAGQAYNYTLVSTTPALPAGLSISGNKLMGRPQAVTTTPVVVKMTTTCNGKTSAEATFTITVAKATPTVALTMSGTHYAGEATKAAATVTITAPFWTGSQWDAAPAIPSSGWAADSQISYTPATIAAAATTYKAIFAPGTELAKIYNGAEDSTDTPYTPGTKTALTAATIVNTTNGGKPGALGDVLTCTYEPVAVTPVTYQWYTATAATGGTVTMIASANAATYTVAAADYGKYIYCVVDATNSTNGTGTATSNRIPVNYTGSVNLRLDDGTGTPTAADYAIMLHNPADSGNTNDIKAENVTTTTNVITYTTAAGALVPGVTYDVLVKAYVGATAVTTDSGLKLTQTGAVPVVDYYTVTFANATVDTDAATAAYGKLTGATITAKLGDPVTATTITTGGIVLKGQKVTFEIDNTLADTYDYKATWNAAAGTSVSPNAKGATKVVTYSAKTASVSALLALNTYTIAGTADTGITTLTMSGTTAEGVNTFTATSNVTNHSANGAQFTGVPKGTYSIDANNIVIAGEYAYTQTGSSGVSDATVKTFNVVSGAVDSLFNVATVGAKYAITLKAGSAAAGADNAAIASTLAELIYGYADGSTETITVTNTGNRTLYNMKVNNGTAPGTDIVATSTTHPDLLTATGIDLAPTDTATFVVTTRTGLDANNAYIQAFTVTANKADTGSTAALGSGVTYTATQKVAAKPLTAVTIKGDAKDGAKLTMAKVTATSEIADPVNAKTLAYQWESSANGTDGWTNATGTGSTTKEYTVAATDAGKFLRLAVTGSVNYSGVVYSAVTAAVAYTGTVTVKQDGVATTGYTVRLQQSDVTTTYVDALDGDNNGTYVTATGALLGDKTYNVLVQRIGKSGAADVDSTLDITKTQRTATVDYYTVNFTSPATVSNLNANSGENFVAPAVTAALTTGSTDVPNGTPVLKDTKVIFTVATWSTDYTLGWSNGGLSIAGRDNTNRTAEVTYSQVYKEAVKATLTQKSYTVTGHFIANNLTALTLTRTDNGHTEVYSGTGAITGTSQTFTVPKGSYTITATPGKDVTLKGYNLTNDTVGGPTQVGATGTLANLTANGTFGVVTVAATYRITLQADSATAGDDNTAISGSKSETYGTTPTAVTLTIKSTGNAAIKGMTYDLGGAQKASFKMDATATKTELDAKGGTTTSTTLKLTPNTSLAAGSYVGTVTVKGTGLPDAGVAYTYTYKVTKAKITAAAVTGVVQPVNGTALADTATIPASVNYSIQQVSGKNVVWSPATTPAAPGTAYTATVVLEPNANYEFDGTTLDNFTINTGKNSDANVEVTVTANDATLKYTFPATAPTVATATLEATSYDKATATATVTSDAAATVYYALYVGNGTPSAPTADVIKAGTADATNWKYTSSNTAGGYSANFTGLSPYKSYTLYATAVVTANAAAGPLSAVASGTDTTFHKVTVAVDDAAHGNITAPAGATSGTVTVGVDHGTTLAITATELNHWRLKTWTIAPDTTGGAVTKADALSTTYTASGTAAEVTLTATYEASYGITYDVQDGNATAPTDPTKYRVSGTVTTQSYSGTKTGFTFGGWSAQKDGSNPIAAGSDVTIAALAAIQTGIAAGGSYTLYAKWTPKTITAAATAMAAGTYGTANYSYSGITAKYTGDANNIATGLTYAVKAVGSDETALTGLGLNLAANGAITGRPQQVGTFKFTVTVTDSVSKSTDDVQLTLIVGKATPTLKVKYAAGTYYADDPYDSAKLTSDDTNKSVATAPYYDGTQWVALDGQVVDGAFAFTTAGNYVSGPTDYGVTFTPGSTGTSWKNGATDGAANVLYNNNTGDVSITAIGKTYGITLVDSTTTTSAANGTFAEGVYLDSINPTVTFKIKNEGNQKVTLTADSYVLSGAATSNFEVTNPVTSVDGSAISTGTVTVTMKTDNLKVGTYAETLTVTDNYNNKVTLDLSYTVTPKVIPSAAITGLVVPVKGGTPVAADVLTGSNNTADANKLTPYGIAISWAPNAATFAAGTVYTATVTLKANANYKFAAESANNYTIAEVGGVTPDITVTTGAGGTVTYKVTFPATAPGTLTMTASATSHTAGKIDKLSVSPIAVNADFFYVVSTAAKTYADGAALKTDYTAGVTGTIVKVGTAANVTDVNGKAEVLNTVLDTLAAGTTYYIYAVAANTGTVLYSNVASAEITTDYQVIVALDGTKDHGTVNVGTYYVKKGSTQNLTATPHAGYKFDKWTVDAENGTFTRTGGSETGTNNYAFAPAIYTPTGNVTITGAFVGIPVLTVTGTPTGNEVAEGYDAATINVYQNGVLKNEGGGNMTGTLAYAIVGKGGGFATTNSNTDFTVKLGATTALAVNGTTTIEVNPATGLKMNSDKSPKSYEATIWVYETGNDTNRCKLDVKVVVVDPNGLVVNPADKEWNLQSGATNTNWIITVTEGSFNTFESLKFGSVILDGTSAGDATGTDYSYTVINKVGTLTIPTTYLTGNAASKKAGDKDVFTLTMQSSGATTAEKTLTLTYVNSTPTVNSVAITYNDPIVKNSVLTAIPTVSSGTPTAGQVTYAWYSTTLDSVPSDPITPDDSTIWLVQANGNGNTYTVQEADAGKKFFVVATGDSTNYLGKAKSILTGAGGVTVAVEAVPTVGGTVTTDNKTVAIGNFVNITATAAPGYLFTGWSIKTSSGEGKFDNNTTGGTTSTIANTTFYPIKDSTLQANFDLLPTVTPTTASYDVGNNPGTPNTIPVLTYAQNNGEATVVLKSKDSTDAEITLIAGTDYTFAQSGVGAASGTYTLAEAGLKKMQVGANTLTFDNSKTGSSYDCAATITITKTMNQIIGATLDAAPVVGTTVTVTAQANHGTPADNDLTYRWYVSDTANNVGGTAIDGATSKTYVVPLTATVGGTANTSLIGKYLYAVATGTGTNFEGAATTAVQKIPNPIYTVTANGESAKGKVSVNGKTPDYTGVTGTAELGKSVNLSVTPDAGYKFSKWTLATANAGSFTSANGGITEVTTAGGTATFFPTANATVKATFVPGTITFADSANGVAKYMTQTLQTVPTVSATSDVGGVTFTYTEAGTSDSYNGNAVPTSTKPAWLTLANNGTFSVTGSSWIDTDLVKNSTTEVVVYVKATASAGGVSKVAKVTIDLIPGDLTVTAPTYTAAKPTVGDTLDVTKFTANVQNAKAEKLETTGVAVSVDGTWVVAPATATGTNETYTLTYTYKKNAGGAISNYNTGTTTLTIAANPASSGIGVSENNAGVYATAQNRALNVTYPASVDTTYTVSVKNTGSSKLYDITLSTAADAATKAMFTLVDNGVNSKAELNGSAVAGTFTLTPTGDAAKVGIHEITYTVEGWTGDNGTGTKVSATYTLTVTVTAATVAGVKVTVPAPVTGDAIKNQPEITISGGKTDFNGTTVTNDAGTTLPDGTKVKVEWMEETTPGVFAPTTDTTFLPNKVYKPVITVKVDGNHKLPAVDANSTINTNTNGNGGATITVASPDTAGNNVVLEQTFPKTKVNEIAVTASATYDTDLSAANKPISANPALYTVVENTNATTFDNWKWYESDGTTPLKGNKFGRNTTYYVEAKVTVAPGANFEEVAKLLVTGNSTSLTSGLLTGAVEKFSRDSDTQITVKFKVTTGGPGGGGGGGGGETTLKVTYDLSKLGTTKDKTSESVVKGEKPKNVPAVTPKEDYAFAGWAETKDMKDNEKDPILVDPTTVVIEKSKTFYAIYKTTGEHEHYIVGYLDGNFGPADSITRGEVAAIIARSCMEGFEMKKDYGTGGYSDIDGSHWATSAIAFCSNAKIYVGYDDGTFRPDQAITRQEFAQLFARLSGMLSAEGKDVPFTDKGDIANWALDGVYTTVEKEWVVGYEDGTFKPNQDIARAEAVRIVNGYLVRGVNKSGLKMVEKDLKQWPDVPTTHWAYTEILEASNDHTFYFVNGKKPPEGWSKAFIEAPHWNQ